MKELDLSGDDEFFDCHVVDLVLSGQSISSKEFVNCRFVGCDFSETIFKSCRFEDCTFQKCNLSLIRIPDCSFTQVLFEASKMIGVNWTRAVWRDLVLSVPVTFLNCDVSLSTFLGLKLPSIQLKGCRAHDADFREADLADAQLTETDFHQSQFIHTNLTGADLTDAKNYTIDIFQNTITGAKFTLPEALSLLDSLEIEWG